MTDVYEPRKWQREASARYFHLAAQQFLLEACPGAGKTKWALSVARQMMNDGTIDRVVIVCPLKSVKRQWVAAATIFNLNLDGRYRASRGHAEGWDLHGIAITYGAVLGSPKTFASHCQYRRTLVILDEIHHAAEHQKWGQALKQAFGEAYRILSLSGTPFRRNGTIPFVEYEPNEHGDEVCRADFRWTYRQERSEEPSCVRAVEVAMCDGSVSWRDPATEQDFTHALSEVLDDDGQDRARLHAALNARQSFMEEMVRRAHAALLSIRKDVPDAGGLILARSVAHAVELSELLMNAVGVKAEIAAGTKTGDERRASELALESFQAPGQDAMWLIAVRMAAEGFDCPRLRVLLYASNQLTEWAVVQAVGRIVRGDGTGFVFAPADPEATRLFSSILDGFTIVKNVAMVPDNDDDDAPDRRPFMPRFEDGPATLTRVVHLIEGGSYGEEEIEALRQATAQMGIVHQSNFRLATQYVARIGIDTRSRDLEALNARADAPIAILALTLVERLAINRLVDQLSERRGRTTGSINYEISRRWNYRDKATLPQLWDIHEWLDAQIR